jgi:hypothetical protein
MTKRVLILALVLSCFAWALSSFSYEEAEGPGYPEKKEALLEQRDRLDMPAMRVHGWDLWAAITHETESGFPAFLTWYQVDEVFGQKELSPNRSFSPSFNHPVQKTLGLGDAILSFNTYNQPMYDHIRENGYNDRDTLNSMVGKVEKVEDFPDPSIMVKTVWWPVRADGLTALAVWDDEPLRPVEWGRGVATRVKRGEFDDRTKRARKSLASHELDGNDFETFKRVVAIEPSASGIAEGEVTFFDVDDLTFEKRVHRVGRRVPLDRFFSFKLEDPKLVKKLNSLPDMEDITTMNWGRPLQLGDYLVMVAAHVSTREIDDWVWATYWWHDRPNDGMGADRLDSIKGVWRDYRMRVAYHGVIPREPDGSPNIAYNPYLEAGFSEGVKSNCVSCHQRAVITSDGKMGEVFPLAKGQLDDDDPFFKDKLQLDFVWSLATRTKKSTPKPLE